MPTGDAFSSGHLVPSLWDLHMFYLLSPILFRTCRYFSGLCSSNIPRYFLDFTLYLNFMKTNIFLIGDPILRRTIRINGRILQYTQRKHFFKQCPPPRDTRIPLKHDYLFISKIQKVPRGIRGEKSSKDMASSRNLVSTIGALASPKMGDGTRCPEG